MAHSASRRPTGDHAAGSDGARARIAVAVELHAILQEQLLRIRRAHRSLIAATETDVFDRCPVQAELVRVGVESQAVVGIPIAGFNSQVLSARLVLHERHARFNEQLLDVERTDRVELGRTLTEQIVGLIGLVGLELLLFAAIFRTERDAQTVTGSRQLGPVLTEVSSDRAAEDLFDGLPLLESRDLHIVERRPA